LPAECIQATGRALLTNRLTPASDRDCRRPHRSKAECAALFRPTLAGAKAASFFPSY
jgi:hypothetical protein